MYHSNANVDLMQENEIQVNGGMMINVVVIVKNIIHVKKVMSEILLHVIVKMKNILQALWMIQQFFVMKV